MKKITKVLMASALIAPCMAFAGCDTTKTNVESAQETQTTQSVEDKKMAVYQLAVEAGYEGTYEEWLASIKGEKGEKGDPGIQGEKGDPGKDGREIELRVYNGVIQWHYVGEDEWADLQETADLTENELFNKFRTASKNTAGYSGAFTVTEQSTTGDTYDGKKEYAYDGTSKAYELNERNNGVQSWTYEVYDNNGNITQYDSSTKKYTNRNEENTTGVLREMLWSYMSIFNYNDDYYGAKSDICENATEYFDILAELLANFGSHVSNASISFKAVNGKNVCTFLYDSVEKLSDDEYYKFKSEVQYIYDDDYVNEVLIEAQVPRSTDGVTLDVARAYIKFTRTFDSSKMPSNFSEYTEA